jgi:excisionase family DNA binding protein
MTATKKAEALYPVAEVAALWRCSDDTIYRLIAAGRLRSMDIGTGAAKTRIPESALAEFVAKHTRPATKEHAR